MKDQFWRIRISVLWIADAVAITALFLLSMFRPGAIDEIMTGKLSGVAINASTMLLTSFLWIVPLLMMVLSLFLGRSVARGLNITFGLILGLISPIDFIDTLVSSFEAVLIAGAILQALAIAFQCLIVWHAWKWPQELD